MHGEHPMHSVTCRPAHPAQADCPVDCLAPLLPSRVLHQLARAQGRYGNAVPACGAPATVGDVVRLFRQGRLGEIAGLGQVSLRKIEAALVSHGLIAVTEYADGITLGCPVDCLRSVMQGRVFNRLARADGRGLDVAPCGPPATVGDVVRLYQEQRLGEIAGLGPSGLAEIEVGLVFAGLVLVPSQPDGEAASRAQRPQAHPGHLPVSVPQRPVSGTDARVT
jgi:hypothetical protein